jgi:hypothetical protein
MLRKNYLFELIKSLNIHEKRYLLSKGSKSGNQTTAYSKMISCIYRMDEYSEIDLKRALQEFSISDKTDVKKHYLYHWILKHLYDYHSSNYSIQRGIRDIQLLVDRSLIHHAHALIPGVKSRIIESEKYVDLLMILEIELRIQKYQSTGDSLRVMEELIFYSRRYADLQLLETIRYKLRQILNCNMFSRSESDQRKINLLFDEPIIRSELDEGSFLINYNYNLLHFWKHGTDNNWEKAFKYARKNFDLLNRQPKVINHFPDIVLQIAYNFITSASIANHPHYDKGVRYLKRLSTQKQGKRLKDDTLFYIHLTELIHFNRNGANNRDHRFINEAEAFIEKHEDNFSAAGINNYYFDLAKSLFYVGEFGKSYRLLNKIYQKYSTKDQTTDFYAHSRLLFCLVCFEIGELELMFSAAKSVSEFMKRNGVYYKFERRIIGFISSDLLKFNNKTKSAKAVCFEKLKADIELIFNSDYEKKVLNYFDYPLWIDSKLEEFNARSVSKAVL